MEETVDIARQLFRYDNHYIKNPALTDYQNPTTESADGQDRLRADWIQNLQPRQFIMRRYLAEQLREDGVQFVAKTSEYPQNPPRASLKAIKQYLLDRRGVPVRDALEVMKARENQLGPALTAKDYKDRKVPRKRS